MSAPRTAQPRRSCSTASRRLPRDVDVSDLTQDGRAARPGCAFLAVRGSAEHGLEYAPQAVANGARAVLWEPAPVAVVPDLPSEIVVAPVPRPARARQRDRRPLLRRAVAAAWRSPASPARTARPPAPIYWRRRWRAAGRPAAYMGTIGTGRPQAPDRERAHHRRRHHRAAHAGRAARAAAPPASRWKCPRTRSTRRASAPCASAPPRSPT